MSSQLVKLRVATNGLSSTESRSGCILIQHVLQVAEPRLQAHHAEFAQTVDRRVRHLAEILPEEMAQRAVLVRQNRRWRVIAHRGQRLLAVLGHRSQNLLQLLNRIARRDLTLRNSSPLNSGFSFNGEIVVQIDDLADPLAKRLRCGQLVLHLVVVEQLALGHIDRNHLPRTKRALFNNVASSIGTMPASDPAISKPSPVTT